MTIIELMAKDQKLDIMVEPVVAAGDVKSTKIHVEFSPEWSGYAKTAVFFTSNDAENVIEQVMTDNTCKVPAEVIEKATNLFIGVRGVIASTGAVKTSTLVKYKIEEGAPCGTGTTVPPTADVYQQLLSKTNDLDKRLSNLLAAETKDGEVIDMRVGADGVKYGTAGEAVRAQLKAITDKFAPNEITVTLEESQIDKALYTFRYTTYGEIVSTANAQDDKGYFLIVKEVQKNDIVKLSENVVLDDQNPYTDRIVFTDKNHAMTSILFFNEIENNDREFRVPNDGYMYLTAEYTSDTTDLFTIKRMVNFIQSPKTAKVGQMLVVEAVDENGFPAAWKAVTPSSSGGGAGGIVWKGEWVENGPDGKGYAPNDVVSYEGNLYISLANNTYENPIEHSLDWELFLESCEVTAENIKTALGYQPADKKNVDKLSEEIDDLKQKIDSGESGGGGTVTETIEYDMSTVDFECGTVKSDGTNLSNNYRIRTVGAIKLPADATISVDGFKLDVAEYSAFSNPNSFVFVKKRGFSVDDYVTTEEVYVRLMLTTLDEQTRFEGDTTLIESAIASVSIAYTVESESGSSEPPHKRQNGIPRTILPYLGYKLEATTDEEANAPTSGNLANLYAKWDSLIDAYPNNVSKEVLGVDASNNEIRCYTITSNSDQFKWTVKNPQTNLKILWLSGLHGHESTIFVDDLKFFTELLKQDNEVTARLMDNCTFKVVPVICPWGYENGSRTNSNGVNLNRNFETKWEYSGEGTNNFSGESPMSEAETQIIAQFLESNKDCYMAINRHSSAEFAPTSALGYFVSQFEVDRKIAFNMARFMSNQIKRTSMFQYISNADTTDADMRCLHTVEESTNVGTMDKYYNAMGIHGFLYEASPANKYGDGYFNEDFGRKIWQRINVTNIGNLLYSLMLQNEYISK